jgi:hypothetical protein
MRLSTIQRHGPDIPSSARGGLTGKVVVRGHALDLIRFMDDEGIERYGAHMAIVGATTIQMRGFQVS